jgi:hypothetical protein
MSLFVWNGFGTISAAVHTHSAGRTTIRKGVGTADISSPTPVIPITATFADSYFNNFFQFFWVTGQDFMSGW